MQTVVQTSLVPRAATLTLLVLLGALSGCGQKGPLELPAAAPAASGAAGAGR
jgi:predicted small lipoprotein YifL